MDPILELAERYNLLVIEDACQAHGAEYHLRQRATLAESRLDGKAGGLQLLPRQESGSLRRGGAVTTDDAELAGKIRMLRDHGQSRKYFHDVEGYNGRLDAIQAGILQVKLRHLAEWNGAPAGSRSPLPRDAHRDGHGLSLPPPTNPNGPDAVYHLYVIRVQDRDGFMRHLAEANIGTADSLSCPAASAAGV